MSFHQRENGHSATQQIKPKESGRRSYKDSQAYRCYVYATTGKRLLPGQKEEVETQPEESQNSALTAYYKDLERQRNEEFRRNANRIAELNGEPDVYSRPGPPPYACNQEFPPGGPIMQSYTIKPKTPSSTEQEMIPGSAAMIDVASSVNGTKSQRPVRVRKVWSKEEAEENDNDDTIPEIPTLKEYYKRQKKEKAKQKKEEKKQVKFEKQQRAKFDKVEEKVQRKQAKSSHIQIYIQQIDREETAVLRAMQKANKLRIEMNAKGETGKACRINDGILKYEKHLHKLKKQRGLFEDKLRQKQKSIAKLLAGQTHNTTTRRDPFGIRSVGQTITPAEQRAKKVDILIIEDDDLQQELDSGRPDDMDLPPRCMNPVPWLESPTPNYRPQTSYGRRLTRPKTSRGLRQGIKKIFQTSQQGKVGAH